MTEKTLKRGDLILRRRRPKSGDCDILEVSGFCNEFSRECVQATGGYHFRNLVEDLSDNHTLLFTEKLHKE